MCDKVGFTSHICHGNFVEVCALRLLNMSGYKKRVRNVTVSVYDLIPSTSEQLEMFSSPTHAVSEAMDKVNDRWGEFVITPALMMGTNRVTTSYTPVRTEADLM